VHRHGSGIAAQDAAVVSALTAPESDSSTGSGQPRQ
jgi:hypothetical protein